MTASRVPFVDLTPGEDIAAVREAIDRVVSRGWFVLGPEVEAFESEFAAASGAPHAVGVGTGTDALMLLLKGLGIGPGDEVIVPAMTAAYSGLAVTMAGATPVFADVEPDTLTLSPAAFAAAVTPRTVAVMPVHLYGQPANMTAITAVASRHGLAVVEDCCQAHLATSAGRPVGTMGIGGAFSFYPTKNLGALGDGGAVITTDTALAERVRRLRNGGQATRYLHVEAGCNSRLDEIQAAILRARLPRLRAWTARRVALAAAYRRGLTGSTRPLAHTEAGHVYHLFVVQTDTRDALRTYLDREGVATLIHYPVPLPEQPAFGTSGSGSCPVAQHAAGQIVSLPLHPRLTDADVAVVVAAVSAFEKGQQFA